MRLIFHKVIFPVKVVVNDRDVPWFWPETEVLGQDVLIGKVEQAYGPLCMVTLEEVLGIVEALIDDRGQLILP